jgi:hypothetical protein
MTSTKQMIGPGRLSFARLLEPKKADDGSDRWETALLLPPTYDIAPHVAALEAAAVAKFGADKSKWPKGAGFRKPSDVFRKADDSDYYSDEFAGWYVVNASSRDAPGVVDANVDDVTDKREVYSGRWARLSVNAYGYTTGKKGVTFGLNNVQVLRHDKPLGGKAPAKSDFDAVAEDMADAGDFD